MLNKRMILVSAATAACALGIGFLMQPSTSLPSSTAAALEGGVPQDPAVPAPLAIEKITLTSANQTAAQTQTALGLDLGGQQAPDAGCAMQARATAHPGALVALYIAAPCRAGERITLHHQGMMVTETLDAEGSLDLLVPALASTAVFIIEPSLTSQRQSTGAVAQVEVPDMAEVDRVVLQWGGNSGFEIHAREFGAQYGALGHVWHGADQLGSAGAGQVMQLGDASQLAPRLAEVYSFQRSAAEVSGVIEISVETEISEINCGRDISAQTLRISGDQVQTRDLTLSMPDCTATGDFLVLNNLVENLKIAAK
ncbi:hypothetical protein [Pseudophaeobacter sp.]|uniref:hypothetical protein n=1 Tax=Pseudophaeobacter sp. TaxID=1971739 RepID=UPI0040582F17